MYFYRGEASIPVTSPEPVVDKIFLPKQSSSRYSEIFHYKEFYSVETDSEVSLPSTRKARRYSLNPVVLPDFLRRVSITQMGRKLSLRSQKLSSRKITKISTEEVSSSSQPHLNQSLKRSTSSQHLGLARTRSVSGTFFRRTQRKLC